MSNAATAPKTDVDLFGPELAGDPYPTYRRLRELGRAVHVPEHGFWLISRYDDVRAAAADWQTYTSAHGVALLDQFNEPMLGTILATDPPAHDVLRSVLSSQLAPRALGSLRQTVTRQIDVLVDEALADGAFDAVSDLTSHIPVQVVADLIGVPEEGRELLLSGADATFGTFGPMTPTVQASMEAFMAFLTYMRSFRDASKLRPGSWGADIYTAVEAGRIDGDQAGQLMMAYLVAGMDTTANSLTALIETFTYQPEIWRTLKAQPDRAGAVFEETLRMESPVQGFFRVATRDVSFDDVTVPEGDRVLLHFGSANRDDRHYDRPDDFSVERNPVDHMAFGYGTHSCAGQGLARIEARALVAALLDRVDTFQPAGAPHRHHNSVVRGLDSLPVTVTRKA